MIRTEQIEYAAQTNYPDDAILRRAFELGSNWANTTMIEKACKWLKRNTILAETTIERFKQAMEE